MKCLEMSESMDFQEPSLIQQGQWWFKLIWAHAEYIWKCKKHSVLQASEIPECSVEDLMVSAQSCLETPGFNSSIFSLRERGYMAGPPVPGCAPVDGFPTKGFAPCRTISGASPYMMQLIRSLDKSLKNNQESIIL